MEVIAGGRLLRALGLMSGTSLDGIDVAYIETDGEARVRRGHAATYPYSDTFRDQLRQALADARDIRQRDERPGRLRMIEQYLTDLHGEAVQNYLTDHQIDPGTVDVIGFHGQTVLHRPEARLTVQLGDAERLARLTGRDVVFDMRAADVDAGGQGAPLAPAYHMALVGRLPGPVVFVNVGGVSNITYIPDDGAADRAPIAFDTGPGNALLDDWMSERAGVPCDRDGAVAATGTVDEGVLTGLMTNPYFSALPPKSLDRNDFSRTAVAHLSTEDGAATLTAFTAATIAAAAQALPEQPRTWVISGGGRRNRTLMSMLAARVQNAVVPAEALNIDGDAVEAEAWAYLAVRSVEGKALTYPGTTGVAQPMTGGVLVRAPRR